MSLPDQSHKISESLAKWNAGDLSVEPALMAQFYPVLRALAQDQLSHVGPITMQATELANEAFIRLRLNGAENVNSQQQFTGFMARVLRNLIVDHIRLRKAQKRGGESEHIQIEQMEDMGLEEGMSKEVDWLALDSALGALEKEDESYARLVELRYFLGYTIERSAEILGVSSATANRMWRFSRAFLSEHMRKSP